MDGALAELPLRELLEQIAEATPAPGGGSACAVACAIAAGLVEMAAGYGGDRLRASANRAQELRERALELAELELSSYAPVLEAQRLPAADPDRQARLARALSDASQAPLEIAAAAAELAGLAAETARLGSPGLQGDAVTSALLAEGACRAAAGLVEINLQHHRDDRRLKRAAELAREAASAREQALSAHSRNKQPTR